MDDRLRFNGALPGRSSVIIGVGVRAWAVAIVGGGVVGLLCGLALMIEDGDGDVSVVPFVALLGVIVGFVLGLLLGLGVAMAAGAALVPYPGRDRTIAVARYAGTGAVAVLIGLVGFGTLGASLAGFTTVLSSIALAWVSAPMTVAWYAHAMDAAA